LVTLEEEFACIVVGDKIQFLFFDPREEILPFFAIFIQGGLIQRLLHLTHLSDIILLNDIEFPLQKLYPFELAFKHRRHRVDNFLADQINRINCHFFHPKSPFKIKYLYSLIKGE
jgi:hypothetical protein